MGVEGDMIRFQGVQMEPSGLQSRITTMETQLTGCLEPFSGVQWNGRERMPHASPAHYGPCHRDQCR